MNTRHVMAWRSDAECARAEAEEIEKFFPTGRPASAPKTMCRRCPVQDECLEFALESPWRPEAIVAGLTPRQLDPLWRERHPDRTETRAEYAWLGLR